MRVAILSSGLETERARLQPHRTLLEMGRELAARGHEVLLLGDGPPRGPEPETLAGMPLRRVGSTLVFRGRRNAALAAALREAAPDLLLRHLSLSSLYHQRLDGPTGIPTLAILTSPIQSPREILRLGARKLSTNLDLVLFHLASALVPERLVRAAFAPGRLAGAITLSERTRAFLVARGAPPDRLWVVPPGVGPEWLEAAERPAARDEFGPDEIVVSYFGSPAPVRGLYTLLDAARRLVGRYPALRLQFLSRRREGQWRRESDWLRAALEREETSGWCRLVDGFLSPEELTGTLAASDAIALPFELVPSDVPLTILESMALGKPVISSRVASIPEMLAEERGFLAEPASVGSLATELERVLTEPTLAAARGAAARDFVRRERRWAHTGERLERVLMEVAGGCR